MLTLVRYLNIDLYLIEESTVIRKKRTIYIDPEIDKQIRVAATEDDKRFSDYAEEAFRLFLDKRRKEMKSKK